MDLNETIRQLRAERARLEAAIAQLRSLAGDGNPPASHSHRGRKFMGPAERREVSARMKKYWESRRRAQGSA